jgi:hypothetical protein
VNEFRVISSKISELDKNDGWILEKAIKTQSSSFLFFKLKSRTISETPDLSQNQKQNGDSLLIGTNFEREKKGKEMNRRIFTSNRRPSHWQRAVQR